MQTVSVELTYQIYCKNKSDVLRFKYAHNITRKQEFIVTLVLKLSKLIALKMRNNNASGINLKHNQFELFCILL